VSVAEWERRLYPSPRSRDPVANFLSVLYSHTRPDCDVLDLGAGAGKNSYELKGRVKSITGVDFDPRVTDNGLLDRGVVAKPGPLPFQDDSFDVVFSIYVLEHVTDPKQLVEEIRRVLKPGGVFLALTPNRYHYVPLIAMLTPHSFHQRLNKARGREAEDTFPTVYLMNTRRDLLRYFANGFECLQMDTIEVAPNYLRFSTPSFLLGALYGRIVSRFDSLAALRVNIICAFRKTSSAR
jgi:SAM-dependent methyltransferase